MNQYEPDAAYPWVTAAVAVFLTGTPAGVAHLTQLIGDVVTSQVGGSPAAHERRIATLHPGCVAMTLLVATVELAAAGVHTPRIASTTGLGHRLGLWSWVITAKAAQAVTGHRRTRHLAALLTTIRPTLRGPAAGARAALAIATQELAVDGWTHAASPIIREQHL